MATEVIKGFPEVEQKVVLARPHFIIIRGLPGSGKSTLAQALRDVIATPGCFVADPDDLGDDYLDFCSGQAGEDDSRKYWPYRYLICKTEQALREGRSVVWNQAWTKVVGIECALDRVRRDLGQLDYQQVVVDLEIPEEAAIDRIAHRTSRSRLERSMADFVASFEKIPDDWRTQEVKHMTCNAANSTPVILHELLGNLGA